MRLIFVQSISFSLSLWICACCYQSVHFKYLSINLIQWRLLLFSKGTVVVCSLHLFCFSMLSNIILLSSLFHSNFLSWANHPVLLYFCTSYCIPCAFNLRVTLSFCFSSHLHPISTLSWSVRGGVPSYFMKLCFVMHFHK